MRNPRYLMGPPPSRPIPAPIVGAITNTSEGRLSERNPSFILAITQEKIYFVIVVVLPWSYMESTKQKKNESN